MVSLMSLLRDYDFITKYTEIFCWKNERSFCNAAKASHIFSTKIIGIFEKLTSENLTEC